MMENANVPPKRILIVDDAEGQRFILRNIIVDMGCQPVLAESGVQALKILPRCRPQLILLDVAMPEMDGYEVCKALRDDPEFQDIPVILASAFEDTADILKGFAAGCTDYLAKPYVPEIVKARVGVHLKLAEAMAALSRAGISPDLF